MIDGKVLKMTQLTLVGWHEHRSDESERETWQHSAHGWL